jgi:SNF2 family DNA or RNA helicase
MKPRLHGYQTKMVSFMLNHPHCGLFVDMGLGKTLCTLTAFDSLYREGKAKTMLVIAPKKVAETTWSSECQKWENLSHYRVAKVIGTKTEREKAALSDADIYVLGRDNVKWFKDYVVKEKRKPLHSIFDILVLDELTSFKSHASQRFKALKGEAPKFGYVYGLTGTPAPNGYGDLWAQMMLIDGGDALGRTITEFRGRYCYSFQFPGAVFTLYKVRNEMKDEILKAIEPKVLQLSAKGLIELPPCTMIEYPVELDPTARKQYNKLKKDMILQLPSGDDVEADTAAALAMKLLQVCNGAVYTEDGQYECISQAKIEGLVEIVEQAKSPVLVFYQFKHDIKRIKDALKGMNVRKYESADDLADWNEGKIDVLLAHPASCAYGLNMQQGGHVCVWYGTGYNLELFQQANARLYRQGQQYPVMIYILMCKDTIDVAAYKALSEKGTTQENLFKILNQLKKEL